MSHVIETPLPLTTAPLVGMGQILVARDPTSLTSVLGSCVGLGLYHARKRVAGFAHVVLPSSNGRTGSPGKFADTAIAEMLNMFAMEGLDTGGLVAKLTGGANMFGNMAGPLQIGEQNIVACRQALELYHIPLIGEHLGGGQGRRIRFHCGTGELMIEVAGRSTTVI